MNILFSWADAPAAHTLGRTLLHTLWQAPLIAAALWLALKTLPAARARLRHAAAAAALATVVIAAACTHGVLTLPTSAPASTTAAPPLGTNTASAPSGTGFQPVVGPQGRNPITPTIPERRTPWPALLLLTWAAIATLLIANTLRALLATRRLTHGPAVTQVQPWAHDVLADLQQRLNLRRTVRLVASAAAHTPVVLGALFPVIVLPPALAAGLTPDQLRVVLAHELAHIKRHDYLLNLVQRLIEALLFFNPAVWFIGRQIRLEREAACDSAAAAALEGDRLHVARTLVDVLQQLTPANPRATAALALSQPNEPALTQRIARLLNPQLRDAIRIPWPTLTLLFVLTTGALYGIACGSEATVAAVDRIVSPEKYVAQTRDAVRDVDTTLPSFFRDERGEPTPADRVTVAGEVVAYDGRIFDTASGRLRIAVESQNASLGTGTSLRPDSHTPTRLTFEDNDLPPGRIRLVTRVAGFGPAISEPFTLQPGEKKTDIRLVLPKGVDLPVRVVDIDGRPVPGAAFDHVAEMMDGNGYYLDLNDQTTDADGRMVLSDTGAATYRGVMTHPGYERQQVEITPQPGGTWSIQLQHALPLDGVVTRAATGEPLAGARIRLAWDSATKAGNDPRNATDPPLTTTDAQGRFALTSLARHALHTLWVEADGHAPVILQGVAPRAGASPLRVELATALRPRFRVEGPLELLDTDRQGRSRLQLNQDVRFREDSSNDTFFYAHPDPEGDGHTFTFDAPLVEHAVETTVTAGSTVVRLDDLRPLATQPRVLTLTAPDADPAAATRRAVVIHLTPPPGWPTPEGTAKVTYRLLATDRHRSSTSLPITDGAVRFNVLLDTPGGMRQDPGFTLDSVAAPGYWLPLPKSHADNQTAVPPGAEPLAIERQLQPAGLVTGRVTDAAGHPLADANLSLNTIDAPPTGRLDPNTVNNFSTDLDGRFAIFPAPFGGTYRVTASSPSLGRYAGVRTDAFTVDGTHPRKERDVIVPRGTDVVLTVLDPDGNPLANVPLDVNLSRPGGSNGWSPGERTGGDGTAVLAGIDLAASESVWTVEIAQVNDYQPARITLDRPAASVTLQHGVSFTGRVIDAATLAPVSGLTVKALIPFDDRSPGADWNTDTYTATTGPDGAFTFRGLTPGRTYQAWFDSSDAAEEGNVNRDASGKITGITMDGTRFTAPADPDTGSEPLTLRVVVNPWNR